MEGYIVGYWARRILHAYWNRLQAVARAGGYYGEGFQGFWGVTQWDPLSPTIFNLVVDAVVRHWVLLVEGLAGGKVGWGREVLHRSAFLYADDGLVISTDPD